jgi:HD-GYP domain-containing protein (c-di-GMP phosphodiesterase class II)
MMMPEQAHTGHAVPLFSAHVEAKAMEALNVVIMVHGADRQPFKFDQLVQLQTCLTHLVDALFPPVGDTVDFSGLDSLDGNEYTHPIKVAELAIVIGRELGKPRSALIDLAMSAALMNIGNLALRSSIIEEPRHLLEGEWEQHEHTHPAQGVSLLEGSGISDAAILAVGQHHERWDGSGYPEGLRDEQIARNARILGVADTFVSLRSIRPYRAAVPFETALRRVAEESGKLFDPEIVDAFQQIIVRYAGIVVAPSARSASAFEATLAAAGGITQPTRRAKERVDEERAVYRPRFEEPDEPEHQRPRPERPRVAPAQRVDQRSTPVPLPARDVAARPVPTRVAAIAPSPPATTVSRTTPSAPTQPMRRPRRRRRTLFSTSFYVDSAVRGAWN